MNDNEMCDKFGDGKEDLDSGKIEEKTNDLNEGIQSSPNLGKSLGKKSVRLKSSSGFGSSLVNIIRSVVAVIFSLLIEKLGIFNWVLKFFGLALKPLNLNLKGEKRKHSEVDKDDADNEDVTEDLGIVIKKWRPDHVYEAINEFIKKMWGERDTNENIKDIGNVTENDENMNKFTSILDGKWNKKPDINFVSNKTIGIINVGEAEDLIRDLTPRKTILKKESKIEEIEVPGQSDGSLDMNLLAPVEENIETSTPIIQSNDPVVFVFSADKPSATKTDEDIPEDEQSMFSLMTFGEKRVYFAQQIKEQEAAAMKSAPLPGVKLPNFKSGESDQHGAD